METKPYLQASGWFPCRTVLTVKKFLLIFSRNLASCRLSPLLHVLHSGLIKNRSCPSSAGLPFKDLKSALSSPLKMSHFSRTSAKQRIAGGGHFGKRFGVLHRCFCLAVATCRRVCDAFYLVISNLMHIGPSLSKVQSIKGPQTNLKDFKQTEIIQNN